MFVFLFWIFFAYHDDPSFHRSHKIGVVVVVVVRPTPVMVPCAICGPSLTVDFKSQNVGNSSFMCLVTSAAA